ncbi:MAG: efflux RND transporter permease subunit [Gemmatimonadales bacterium]|nr:efflux RND transporter permease subunit [Gemmatimonadales bacterium]
MDCQRAAAARQGDGAGRALVAIVLVLCAVFIPSPSQRHQYRAMYEQFRDHDRARSISAGAALSLTSALPACCLPGPVGRDEVEHRGFFGWFNWRFHGLTGRYTRTVGGFIRAAHHHGGLRGADRPDGGAVPGTRRARSSPRRTRGSFAVAIQFLMARLEAAHRGGHRAGGADKVLADPARSVHAAALVGVDALSFAAQTNSAIIFVNLKLRGGADHPDLSIEAVVAAPMADCSRDGDARSPSTSSRCLPGTTSGLRCIPQARGADFEGVRAAGCRSSSVI